VKLVFQWISSELEISLDGQELMYSNEAAFKNGDFSWQERMMDHIISAMESSMIGFK
jgi:hypothetical protein